MGAVKFLIAVLLGVSMLGYGWTMHQNQQADVQEAVTVEGTVQSTDVEHVGSSSANNPGGGSYHVTVRYTYTYEGQEYTSENVYPGPQKDLNKENANELANRYSPGQTTTVYVNRETPSRSFLIKEKTTNITFAIIAVGALFTLAGLFNLGKTTVGGVSGG